MSSASWSEQNHAFVDACIRSIRAKLTAAVQENGDNGQGLEGDEVVATLRQLERVMTPPPKLLQLRDAFELSSFEYELLLLCVAAELSSEIGGLCARVQADQRKRWPSFGLALALLPNPHWSALSPDGPLRRFHLIERLAGSLTDGLLQVTDRVLQEILGLPCFEEQLRGVVTVPSGLWVPEHFGVQLSETRLALEQASATVVLLGGGRALRRSIAARAVASIQLNPLTISAGHIPVDPRERDAFFGLVRREQLLRNAGLIIEIEADLPSDRVRAALEVAAESPGCTVVSASQVSTLADVAMVRISLPGADGESQWAMWSEVVRGEGERLSATIADLAEEFRLDADEISILGMEWTARRRMSGIESNAVRQEGGTAALTDTGESNSRSEHPLRARARQMGRARFGGVAQVIVPRASRDDLVLPPAQADMLEQLERHLRHRRVVLRDWGFGEKETRGNGITALFHGPSGTGKTLAAEVLAARLKLDLVRVDLSQTVSKYIGETEKNLARIFDAADRGGVVLLFDEADALFGKRSEVRDSHDRYANIEVGYLLQRMEAFRGLAILTTNLRQSLDSAFLRRLRFVIHFPFPDTAQRAEIWQRIFPTQMPRRGLDLDRLAKLSVTGGSIRNIALHAAYLAAGDGGFVEMKHLLRATKDECQRIEKPLSQSEVGGWA